jgi:hypothetical protein
MTATPRLSAATLNDVIAEAFDPEVAGTLIASLEKHPLSLDSPEFSSIYAFVASAAEVRKFRRSLPAATIELDDGVSKLVRVAQDLEQSIAAEARRVIPESIVSALDTVVVEIKALARESAMDEFRAASQLRGEAIRAEVAELRKAAVELATAERRQEVDRKADAVVGRGTPALAGEAKLFGILPMRDVPWAIIAIVVIGVLGYMALQHQHVIR